MRPPLRWVSVPYAEGHCWPVDIIRVVCWRVVLLSAYIFLWMRGWGMGGSRGDVGGGIKPGGGPAVGGYSAQFHSSQNIYGQPTRNSAGMRH